MTRIVQGVFLKDCNITLSTHQHVQYTAKMMRTLNKFLATATVWKSAPDYPAKDLKLEKNDDGGWVIYISKELQKLVYYERCATLRSSRQTVADKRYNSKVHGTILVLHYTPPELQGKKNQLTIYKIYKINWRCHPHYSRNIKWL